MSLGMQALIILGFFLVVLIAFIAGGLASSHRDYSEGCSRCTVYVPDAKYGPPPPPSQLSEERKMDIRCS